jgi:hypothetical protein
MTDAKITWHGKEAELKARMGAMAGLEKWAADVASASKREVPVSENRGGGFLRDSQKVSVDVSELKAAVSYSGPPDKRNLPIWVHENMKAQHPFMGKAKFLEGPLNATKTSGPEAVRAEIKRSLGA